MSAVSGPHSSPKTSQPISNDNDTPSLTSRVGLIALACLAILALGFMTGNIGYSILAATAVGVGGLFWVTKMLKADIDKNKLEPYVYVDPKIELDQRVKKRTEQRWREMEDVLGGEGAYDKLPYVGIFLAGKLAPPAHFKHAISRGTGEGPRKLLILKLQNKSGGSPFMCTFWWSQTMDQKNAFGTWQRVDHYDTPNNCFPDGVADAATLETIKQLREGKHPEYKLVHPKIEVINE